MTSYLYAVSEALKIAFIVKAIWFRNWRGTEKQKVRGCSVHIVLLYCDFNCI